MLTPSINGSSFLPSIFLALFYSDAGGKFKLYFGRQKKYIPNCIGLPHS